MGKRPVTNGKHDMGKNRELERQISGLLQSMYGAVEREPVPERFLELLEKLDAAERAQNSVKPA